MRRLFIFLSIIPALVWGQDSLTFTHLGSISDYWDGAKSVVVDGNLAYVASSSAGIRIVDISDLEHPSEIGYWNSTGSTSSISISGNLAFIADGNRLQVVDVSDPTSPIPIGESANSYNYAVDVVSSNNYVYLAESGNGLHVFDVTNPALPLEVGLIRMPHGTCYGLTIEDSLVFLAYSDHMSVIDVSDPISPIEIGSWPTAGNCRDVAVLGSKAFVADCSGIVILDITDPGNMSEIGRCSISGCANSVKIVGSSLYVCAIPDCVIIFDVLDSSNPEQLAQLEIPGRASDIFILDTIAFVAAADSGLHVLDVSTPSSPSEIGYLSRPETARSVSLSDQYIFVAEGLHGIRIADAELPGSPTIVGVYDTPGGAHQIVPAGNYAFVADGVAGLRVLDITEPSTISEIGSFETAPDNAHCIAYSDSLVFIGDNYEDGLRIVDVSNPQSPVEIGFCSDPWQINSIVVADSYAYLACYRGVSIVDVSDPSAPVQISVLSPETLFSSICLSGTRAYATFENSELSGMTIIDVSNPAEPQAVRQIWADYYGNTCTASGDIVFLANVMFGIRAFDFSNPNNGTYLGFLDPPEFAYGIATDGDRLYVAGHLYTGIYGLELLSATPEHHNEIPTQFSLHPIYPNPFNNTANISFDLPREVTGKLVVYDMLGRMTNTLYDGKLAAGSHSMQFNGNGLSSGTYFVRLETPAFTATQKAVLLK